MKLWPVWLSGGVLLAAAAGAVGFVIGDEWDLWQRQKPHEARPLTFEAPVQPDVVGPVRVRFNCPDRPERNPITVKVFYLGVPNEAGRPYANETNDILLDPVYAPGLTGEVIEAPSKAFDHRVRQLLVSDGFGAEIYVGGRNGPYGSRSVNPDEMTGVVEIECETEKTAKSK